MVNRLALIFHPRVQAGVALLALFLQRTPQLRVAVETLARSGMGVPAVLRSAVLVSASLGALDAQTGATQFDSNPPSPAAAKVGEPFQMVFAVTGAVGLPESWDVAGSLPPGLRIPGAIESSVGEYKFNGETGAIVGVPTQPGIYQLIITAWKDPNQTGYKIGEEIIPDVIINVAPGVLSLEISGQPQSGERNIGESFNLEVTVQGIPEPTFQWRRDGQPISGANGSSLTIDPVALEDAGEYTVTVTNPSRTLTSEAARLTVLGTSPTITADPIDQTTLPGGGASFTVSAQGNPPPVFQWMREGVAIEGATGRILNLPDVGQSDEATYSVEVANALGTVVSSGAVLSIDPDGFSRLSNLSTRTQVDAGATLIPGFAIQGSSQAQILTRAVGPTLTSLNVSGAMPDPRFRVVSGGSDLYTNDNWGDFSDQSGLERVRVRVGAFPLDPNSADAALVAALDPGPYTVPTAGVGDSMGVVLVEIYDAGESGSGEPRLVNLSARSEVGTGSNLLIPGFVISGNVAKTVLIRAVGPTLSEFGVAGVLEDPTLRLFAGSRQLASNDDWGVGDDQSDTIAAVARIVGAFPIDPSSKDSALLITLNPGAYTVQVSGVMAATGACLVEIYEVPPQP